MDRSVAQRITYRLRWLAENLGNTRLETLTGDLAWLHKLRVGSYRVLYGIIPEEQTTLVHAIGHRRDVYDQR